MVEREQTASGGGTPGEPVARRTKASQRRAAVSGPAPEQVPAADEQGTSDPRAAPSGARAAEGAADETGQGAADASQAGSGGAQRCAESTPQPSGETAAGAGEQLGDEQLLEAVGALLFASPDPLSERRLAALLDGPALPRVRAALEALRARLAHSGLPVELREIAGGHQLLTRPALAETVQRLFKERKAERISGAALETLSVIAYRQPVTKAEIEAIRGVQAGAILRSLIERGLVRVSGRADVPGHPLEYATTRAFLERFGLADLSGLPRDAELSKD